MTIHGILQIDLSNRQVDPPKYYKYLMFSSFMVRHLLLLEIAFGSLVQYQILH